METNEKQKNSTLGVLALIFSVLGCTFMIGIILAIIDLCKKDGNKKTLSIVALVICGVWLVGAAIMGGSGDSKQKSESTTTETISTEEKQATTTETDSEMTTTEEITTETSEEAATEALTMGQKNALSKAQDYLDFSAFSYTGLISQLEYEGFTTEEATYAADHCGADWNEQAAKKAKSYIEFSSFSRQGLIDQLIYEGFTSEQAEYGATAVGY